MRKEQPGLVKKNTGSTLMAFPLFTGQVVNAVLNNDGRSVQHWNRSYIAFRLSK